MHPRMQMLHWDFKDTAQILPLYAYSCALYTVQKYKNTIFQAKIFISYGH